MEQKASPEVIQRLINKFKEPVGRPQPAVGKRREDDQVKSQVEKAVEKASQDPEASQG